MKDHRQLTIVTHDGRFHADELFAVAFIQLTFGSQKEPIPVIRTRKITPAMLADRDTFVLDVGGELAPERRNFDHHQRGGAGLRGGDGVAYATFGLVWREYAERYVRRIVPHDTPREMILKIVGRVDYGIIWAIDGHDNGVLDAEPKYIERTHKSVRLAEPSLACGLAELNPKNGSKKDYDEAFEYTLSFTRRWLKTYVENTAKAILDKNVVLQLDTGRPILVLDQLRTFEEAVQELPHVLYVVGKRTSDSQWFAVQTINTDSREPRLSFPSKWRGLKDRDLETATGVTGAVFCHSAGFLVVGETRDAVIDLCNRSIELQQPPLARSA